ncbi:4'-phosphopantetheinyl transferase EntD [Dietzia kunjamensis]|uniref:4'-phosphopantetheinyl transferase family protein n=1 Tax=Dietzia kunjamensis TaxID=322509 RepID=UPI000E72A960|nr:4'-phosphopantetheinyl transferase superfamily protein [Dietzia kunjamensis]MBB1013646.1 4'-phosphopantetheinyl transferase superfamily protein [Dietzia kunjamensis]RKE66559.1 4'-phosphopantetheinyl transferase EntD [Dietzia kunjamensis]
MIDDLFPPDVAGVTDAELGLDDAALLASLYPVEVEQIGAAVERRRIDFAGARACAREAMSRLGVPAGPVLRGGRGMPVWPQGLVGTLTHTEGLRAAALAPTTRVRSLGLDVERHAPLAAGVLEAVSLPEEAAWVRAARAEVADVAWDALLFTAKEATYKAWFPLTHRWLGFGDAHITLVPDGDDDEVVTGTLRSRILIDGHAVDGGPDLVEFRGRWGVRDGYVASAIVLRPAGVDSVGP